MVLTPMNTLDEHQKEAGSKPHTTSIGGEAHTERLPPGRRLDARPRRSRVLLWFTIVLILLLISAAIVIRGHKASEDSVSPSLPINPIAPQASDGIASVDPAPAELERRVEDLGAQLALHNDDDAKKIDENTRAVRLLEEKLAQLPTMQHLGVLEDLLKQSRDTFTKDIARLDQSFTRLRSATAPKRTKPSEPALPFQVISLDLWDDAPYVGLSHDGRIELVGIGQVRGGWTVEHIDYGNGRVRFRNETGQTIERVATR